MLPYLPFATPASPCLSKDSLSSRKLELIAMPDDSDAPLHRQFLCTELSLLCCLKSFFSSSTTQLELRLFNNEVEIVQWVTDTMECPS
jgi:hypothetical protein